MGLLTALLLCCFSFFLESNVFLNVLLRFCLDPVVALRIELLELRHVLLGDVATHDDVLIASKKTGLLRSAQRLLCGGHDLLLVSVILPFFPFVELLLLKSHSDWCCCGSSTADIGQLVHTLRTIRHRGVDDTTSRVLDFSPDDIFLRGQPPIGDPQSFRLGLATFFKWNLLPTVHGLTSSAHIFRVTSIGCSSVFGAALVLLALLLALVLGRLVLRFVLARASGFTRLVLLFLLLFVLLLLLLVLRLRRGHGCFLTRYLRVADRCPKTIGKGPDCQISDRTKMFEAKVQNVPMNFSFDERRLSLRTVK